MLNGERKMSRQKFFFAASLAVFMALALPSQAQTALDLDILQKKAVAGDATAQFELGYADDMLGSPTNKDKWAEAEKWYRKAASLGVAGAEYHLGELFSLGRGVEKNDAEARKWHRLAAEQGHADAQGAVGTDYQTANDNKNALPWLLKSADQGARDGFIQTTLAGIYAQGVNGVNADPKEAYFWFALAAHAPYADRHFILWRNHAARYLKPAELAEQDKRVEEWKPHPTKVTLATQAAENAVNDMIERMNAPLKKK